MSNGEFLKNCHGEVRIQLAGGAVYTGHFRTDILSADAVSAYFYGNERDLSLPIGIVESIEHLPMASIAS
ncbi:MAG: hypothetical protein IAI49_09300 [Candidatus Eremiobacteraeota bacterium]|nr:hypothetical protein [Candidatus Eremiobacteraeota bacterium]